MFGTCPNATRYRKRRELTSATATPQQAVGHKILQRPTQRSRKNLYPTPTQQQDRNAEEPHAGGLCYVKDLTSSRSVTNLRETFGETSCDPCKLYTRMFVRTGTYVCRHLRPFGPGTTSKLTSMGYIRPLLQQHSRSCTVAFEINWWSPPCLKYHLTSMELHKMACLPSEPGTY